MKDFNKCPQCGTLGTRRWQCDCGYGAEPVPTPQIEQPKPVTPTPSSPMRRIMALMLIIPVALLVVAVVKWEVLELGRFTPPFPDIVNKILVGGVALTLLVVANVLWTSSTNTSPKR